MKNKTTNGYFESMDYRDKIIYVGVGSIVPKFAYERLLVHRAGVARQMSRLMDALRDAVLPEINHDVTYEEMRAYVARGVERIEPALYEAHYYFVAICGCKKMMSRIASFPEFLLAKKVLDANWDLFNNYCEARHSFEHYDDRLPGGKDEHRFKLAPGGGADGDVGVFWGFEGGKYKHSNREWDVSLVSFNSVNEAINEFISAVHLVIDESVKDWGIC